MNKQKVELTDQEHIDKIRKLAEQFKTAVIAASDAGLKIDFKANADVVTGPKTRSISGPYFELEITRITKLIETNFRDESYTLSSKVSIVN